MTTERKFKHGISGHVKAGFEPVIHHLESQGADGFDKKSQLCVWVGEECVIDVIMTDEPSFTADHKTVIMSSGKSIASIALATQVDKGLVKYEEPVTTYWPEFGQNGKENLKVEDIMRHEAGLSRAPEALSIADIKTENIKQNSIGKKFETAKSIYVSRRQYHAFSRDWLTNEIFRRAEPEGRTLGEYYAQVLRPEFGIDAIVGATDEDFKLFIAPTTQGGWSMFKMAWQGPQKSLSSLSISEGMAMGELAKKTEAMKKEQGATEFQLKETMEIEGTGFYEMLKNNEVFKGESASFGTISNGRSLGRLAAFMANKGTLNGQQLMSQETWENMMGGQTLEIFDGFSKYVPFGRGGHANFGLTDEIIKSTEAPYLSMVKSCHTGREGYTGWFGYGGSVFNWHSELQIGFGYVPFNYVDIDMVNKRGALLQQVVVQCIKGTYVAPVVDTGCQTCTTF